jgi:hypothetical protein
VLTGSVLDLDRYQLLELGQSLAGAVLGRSDIALPAYRIYDPRHRLPDRGWYRSGVVSINLPVCRPATRTPGYAWSFPGYKADTTPTGVVAHEVGHHVDAVMRVGELRGWDRETRVSSYEPNRDEAFAEAFKLFVTNPDLLRVGRPRRWELLIGLGLDPGDLTPWDEVLTDRGAHPRFVAAARNWISCTR